MAAGRLRRGSVHLQQEGRLPEIPGPADTKKSPRSQVRVRIESDRASVARLVRAQFDSGRRLILRGRPGHRRRRAKLNSACATKASVSGWPRDVIAEPRLSLRASFALSLCPKWRPTADEDGHYSFAVAL